MYSLHSNDILTLEGFNSILNEYITTKRGLDDDLANTTLLLFSVSTRKTILILENKT